MKKSIKLTILIPAYNEEKVIKGTLNSILKEEANKGYSWEIVIVDDGSHDSTSKIVKNFDAQKVHLVRLPQNRGKGAALREGVLDSQGNFIIFMDADLSVPLENIDVFLKELEKGFDVVIGSRRLGGSNILVHQPWLRENMGRVYTLLSKIVTANNIADFTCGFKGFTKRAAFDIFQKSLIDRWSYDAEILFLAKKLGYKIREMPVSWVNRSATRVVLGNAVLTSLRDLLKIRLNDISGKYDN